MTDILYFLKHNCNLILRNHIKWNKFPTHNNFSRIIKTFGKNRNYSQTFTEDIYYITKQGNEIETPFSKIMKNKMLELNLKQKDISSLFLSKNGNITGWVSNKLNGTQIPTREQWEKITQLFGIQNNYDDLLYEYNTKSRYKFNQEFIEFKGKSLDMQKELLKPYSEIWEYNKDNIKSFYTAKSVDMLKNIIKISSNENDVILDPFMGSGTTGVACKKLNRNFIGIELDEHYFKLAEDRINESN
jgi:adenine specific DNA methylase Mod